MFSRYYEIEASDTTPISLCNKQNVHYPKCLRHLPSKGEDKKLSSMMNIYYEIQTSGITYNLMQLITMFFIQVLRKITIGAQEMRKMYRNLRTSLIKLLISVSVSLAPLGNIQKACNVYFQSPGPGVLVYHDHSQKIVVVVVVVLPTFS